MFYIYWCYISNFWQSKMKMRMFRVGQLSVWSNFFWLESTVSHWIRWLKPIACYSGWVVDDKLSKKRNSIAVFSVWGGSIQLWYKKYTVVIGFIQQFCLIIFFNKCAIQLRKPSNKLRINWLVDTFVKSAL